MNDVRGNTTGISFDCSTCKSDDGHIRGQFGGRSLVRTSCKPIPHVFHLECITQWLNVENQKDKELHERQCGECMQPALPLIRLNDIRELDDESLYCESLMFRACRTGDLETLKMLLHVNDALANRTYHSVLTGHPEYPLAVAIHNGHDDCVRALINSRADPNAADHHGKTPLHIAAQQRRTDYLQMLTEAGGDISNVMRTAVQEGKAELLEYLISTQPGQLALNSALREAAERGQTECLEILITAGANDLNGALCAAAERGKTECLEILITEGANDLNGALHIAVQTENIKGRDVLEQQGANIITVLHTAAREDNWEFFHHLYDLTYINEPDGEGQTPLHIIAANGHGRCLAKLLATNEVSINARNKNDETALQLAVYNGHLDCLKQLIRKGAKLNATNKNDETALHIATKISINEGEAQCFAMHIKINETLITGRPPKHYTIEKENDTSCLKELINTEGVKINVTDEVGTTPLMIAAFWGKSERLTWLIDAGADINAADSNGLTALHFAAFRGDAESVKTLVNATGIKVNEKTYTICEAPGFFPHSAFQTLSKTLPVTPVYTPMIKAQAIRLFTWLPAMATQSPSRSCWSIATSRSILRIAIAIRLFTWLLLMATQRPSRHFGAFPAP
nr:ankyrin repeat domain-containing protein [Endozoicomonas sp. ONNA2]